MNEQDKLWIDNASYEDLLRKWRYATLGDHMLQGETGEYFSKVMFAKKMNCDHVQASKNVGWE
jgi:hypothetical protein